MSTKTLKKLTALLLSMILSASIFIIPGIFAGAAEPEKISWNFDSETGKLTISGNGKMEEFFVTEEVTGYPWSEHQKTIKEVYIEEGITNISLNAFCSFENLKNVVIPSTVKSIGEYAFEDCSSLESITIPDGVVELETGAFTGCNSLKTVNIGKGLTEFDRSSFYYCKSLETFEVSTENSAFSSEDGVLFNKDKTKLILYPTGNSRATYNVPEGVEIIGTESFMDAVALENISLPDSVIQIDGNPFGGTAFFENEDNWTNGILYINEKYLIFGGYNTEISGDYTIREGTKVIAGCAFLSCDLTSVTIPASVVSVGETAFRTENFSLTRKVNI